MEKGAKSFAKFELGTTKLTWHAWGRVHKNILLFTVKKNIMLHQPYSHSFPSKTHPHPSSSYPSIPQYFPTVVIFLFYIPFMCITACECTLVLWCEFHSFSILRLSIIAVNAVREMSKCMVLDFTQESWMCKVLFSKVFLLRFPLKNDFFDFTMG